MERTLSIIKPDAVQRGLTGPILAKIEEAGLRLIALRMVCLSLKEAEEFYAVHAERPFFKSLVEFMTSGAVVVSALEGESAIARYRELMGATNPEEAAAGTIRELYATNIERNAVHGSDAPETAAMEIAFFFRDQDLVRTGR
jgi:nucleoside-diphosphate kinase